MKLAIYYPWVYLKGGAERTLLEIFSRSRHEWTLYTNHYDAEASFEGLREHPVIELARVSVRRTVKETGETILRLLTQPLPFSEAEALMVVSESVGNLLTLRTRQIPVFCLCLTPLRLAYDQATRQHYFSRNPSPLTRVAIAAFRVLDRLAWRRYQQVFCISQEVANRVRRAKLVPEHKIAILHPGVDLDEYSPSDRRERYFLLPGRIMWTKNIEMAISAFLRLQEQRPDASGFRLVIAGMVDRKSADYLASLQAMASGNAQVEFVMNPTEAELRTLYQNCYAVLFPPFNEDWGLVPLEGMACAKPVVAVARGGPLETVLDGQTGYLVEPDPESFAAGMAELIIDPERASAMGAAGRPRAAEFSWSRFVDSLDNYVDSLAGQHPKPARGLSGAANPGY